WPYPPFSGEIHDGRLWGRGSADMKGPLAAMIHAVGALAREGIRPPGDLYVAAVVQEEVGGLGTQKLVQTVRPDCAVVGEASSNHLARGHRGRVEVVVRVQGRSVHASVPHQGV
ncbi:MAG: M20/M25/M40 family metallo-hydrolase, partial [Planctomycetales bacterium]|nr:M20/M25/M40 family metallo-hydrolase [Planctomycetales bacterium]